MMMEFFLQDDPLKHILPSVDVVKDKIHEEEEKLVTLYSKFSDWLLSFAPRLLTALIVLLIGLWLIRWISRLAEKAMTRRELDISLKTFLKSLLSIGLKIVLVITVAGMVGVGTASFVTILGAAGLAIGLALQGSLSNFAGGVLILVFKPFKVGDMIEAGGQLGEVKEIQIFNTILLTPEHRTVILPNGPLSNGTIINVSRHGDLRADLAFTVSADNDLDKVIELIREVLAANPDILQSPSPKVRIMRIAEGIATINVLPYCITSKAGDLRSELNAAVRKKFSEHGIREGVQERRIHTVNSNQT